MFIRNSITSNSSTPHPLPLQPKVITTGRTLLSFSSRLAMIHTIRFWEAWSGICSRTIQHPDSQSNRLSISPDKRFLAAAANTHIRLMDCSIASPQAIAAAAAAGGAGGNGANAPAQPISTLEGHQGNVTVSHGTATCNGSSRAVKMVCSKFGTSEHPVLRGYTPIEVRK